MSNHVDKIQITVKNFGRELHVNSFELVVAVNTIPAIVLNVLPIDPPAAGSGQKITASAPDIKELTKLYSELLADAVKLNKTADIQISIEHTPDTEGAGESLVEEFDQRVYLDKWIMTDVGLSSLSATDAPILTVTFCHPVVMLDRTGAIYENVNNSQKKPQIFYDTRGSEVIPYMDNLYDKYSSNTTFALYEIGNEHNGGPKNPYRSKVTKIRNDISKYKPGKYIEGKCGSFFLKKIVPGLEGKIRIATGDLVAPKAFCKSTWNRIISSVCPYFLTHVIPTYDQEKLLLEPCSPWQASKHNINTRVITSLDVVSVDPNPIIGTALGKAVTGPHVTDGCCRGTVDDTDEDMTHHFYFPDKALNDESFGEIGESDAIEDIINTDLAANATAKHDSSKGENIESSGNSVSEEDRLKMNDAYLKAMFLINYRKGCKSNISTIPLFKDRVGEMIYPGRVITVRDSSSDSGFAPLYHGYITRIITRGSIDGGGATLFEISHVRPASEDSGLYVEEGTMNPCYQGVAPAGSAK